MRAVAISLSVDEVGSLRSMSFAEAQLFEAALEDLRGLFRVDRSSTFTRARFTLNLLVSGVLPTDAGLF